MVRRRTTLSWPYSLLKAASTAKPHEAGRIVLSRRTFLKTIGLGALGVFGLSSYAFAIEPRFRLVVTRYRLALPHWPAGGRPAAHGGDRRHPCLRSVDAAVAGRRDRLGRPTASSRTSRCCSATMFRACAASAPRSCRRTTGAGRWPASRRRSASMASSAITTGGTTSRACGTPSPPTDLPLMENDVVRLEPKDGPPSG